MNRETAEYYLSIATFKYAKSMPSFPHSYTLKETWENIDIFNEVVLFIRKNGIKQKE